MESVKEANIQVIVRVRPRSTKEIRENSQPIVTVDGSSLTVKLGADNNNSSKMFSYDKVYGPESTQESIFEEVVDPILKEVLLGYNCTVFAYGTTGTGKTYTMNGDMSDVQGRDAGIIPRTLYKLFEVLEQSAEFSYLELYNEELKDLLATDDSSRKLKIFEDLNRKGSVLVQNLEEVQVKCASDVIQTLQRGSLKRQTASTKMNDVSSRSHCIFSITVHIKETTPDGEELLKVGKLNLVDLAGSECVGKSGAESKQAKEAGMINQSLLTLGRVINALVERSPHVPFRESKLTRLLQDSLGGRTKTCIIAAVSPAKSNLDETLSTLEYAHRSKSIRNRPEINQRMTKRTLIKEYVSEIERLKQDLVATREKNGVFMSSDSYATLVEQNDSRKVHIDELLKTVIVKEEQLVVLEAKFKVNVALLGDATKSLDAATSELTQVKKELGLCIQELNETIILLSDQQAITRAHADTEQRLDKIASDLVVSLTTSINETNTLHEKIERKESIELQNKLSLATMQKTVADSITQLEAGLVNMKEGSETWAASLGLKIATTDAFTAEKALCQENMASLTACSRQMLECTNMLHQQASKDYALNLIAVQSNQTEFLEVFSESSSALNEDLIRLGDSTVAYTSSIISNIKSADASFTETLAKSEELSHSKHSYATDLFESLLSASTKEIDYLKAQNAKLRALLASERNKSKVMQDKMKRSFMEMMGEIEDGVDESFGKIDAANVETFDGIVGMREAYLCTTKRTHKLDNASFDKSLCEISALKSLAEDGVAALVDVSTLANVLYDKNVSRVIGIVGESSVAMGGSLDDYERVVGQMNSKNLDRWQSVSNISIAKSSTILASSSSKRDEHDQIVKKTLLSIEEGHDSHARSIALMARDVFKDGTVHSTQQDAYNTASMQSAALISNSVEFLDVKSDSSTGSTPMRSRHFNIPAQWDLTLSHEEIIAASRLEAADTQPNEKPNSRLPRMRHQEILAQTTGELAPSALL